MADMTLQATATVPTGASLTITLYEDTDDDGSAENSASTTVNDGTDTYTLSGFDGKTTNDYWLDATLSSGGDPEVTPSIDSAIVNFPTETMSGQVLGEGEAVEDAVVIIVNTEKVNYNDLGSLSVSDLSFEAVAVTDADGDWSAEVSSVKELHAIAEWTDGTDEANALSKPFL